MAAQKISVWMAIYLVIYVTFSLWSFYDDMKNRKINSMVIIEFIGATFLVISTLAYFNLAINIFFDNVWSTIYTLGMCCLIVFLILKIKISFLNFRSLSMKDILIDFCSFLFVIFFNMPLIWYGSAFLRN